MPKEHFSSGLHAATLCADTPWPWGDASKPEKERAVALCRAVQGIEPRTAAEQRIPQTCLPWPSSRPNRLAGPARKLTMPVLLPAGDRDLSTPPAWARGVVADVPKVRLVMIKGADHSTQRRSDEDLPAGVKRRDAGLDPGGIPDILW
jgi:pimeloyl-ACP methyl ester carboxylesterase